MRTPSFCRRAIACCAVTLCLACGSSSGSAGGEGGNGGVGGTGGSRCVDEAAANQCLDLQNCCESILVNPVFFQSCNSVVLQCNEANCKAVLDGYVQCRALDL